MDFDPKPQFSFVSSWFPGYFHNFSSSEIIIFEEISAVAFQNGTEHLSTTSGREMTVLLFQENIMISSNSNVPIEESIESQENQLENISRQQKALTSRVFGVSWTAGCREVSKIMLGTPRLKKKTKKNKNFCPYQKKNISIVYLDVPV